LEGTAGKDKGRPTGGLRWLKSSQREQKITPTSPN
jgi:hypothetical protein